MNVLSSLHIQHHEVGVLDELFEARAEPGAGGTIDDSVVGTDAEVDHVCLLQAVPVLSCLVVYQLSHSMGLADSDDSSLGSQDGRDEVAAADVAHAAHAEGAIIEVALREPTIRRTLLQALQIAIDLQNTLRLHRLNVWHSQTVLAIDGDRVVVIVFEDVPLDVALAIELVVDVRVHHGVLAHSDGARLDEEGQYGQIGVHLLHFFAQQGQRGGVHLV
mmetsp:Transcript_11920/g.15208  ORF Transcript_11920/g.15208 Transcript_11920/m.15208 type:complete len:218 (-) Transcript_11920:862-1515(-)|eukprot:CAMPEP_0170467566 /NCGR_PEP_ID=MMETSP0123-20130129/11104_1 /TAXON_ID=182087 /ORGANISM="Favella ehrenbergii, Strain Fehren 1" /LENGTH=217 /DNA_ID=CAMNT_0010733979 /DNA_START=150 /DNA_END=803 /DNA_ORIENTATION=+